MSIWVHGHQPEVARGWITQGPGYRGPSCRRCTARASGAGACWRRRPRLSRGGRRRCLCPARTARASPCSSWRARTLRWTAATPPSCTRTAVRRAARPAGAGHLGRSVGGVRLSAHLSPQPARACAAWLDRHAPRLLCCAGPGRRSWQRGGPGAGADSERRARRAGFDITMFPTFSTSRLVFLRAFNGVYAIAGIRCAAGRTRHNVT